jgi:hypothetical protein
MADRDDIEAACAEHGFPLGEISGDDDLLRLSPTSLDALPNAEVLNALADDLEDLGYQFVTFTVPDSR